MSTACEPEQYRDDTDDVQREIDAREEEVERDAHPERYGLSPHSESCTGCEYPALDAAIAQALYDESGSVIERR